MRIAKAVAIAAVALLSLAACSGPSSGSTTPSKPKVAIILGGLANDGGFNEYAADAAKTLEEEGKITLAIRESVSVATDSEPIMRQYAAQGYSLIIGWGLDFSDSVFKVAKQETKTDFVATGGESILKQATNNVETWSFSSEQDGYLIGWIAGKTKLSPIGVVDGELAPFNETSYKYAAYGLKQANPDAVQLKSIFTGDWNNTSLANQAAQAQIAAGAKLIITGAEAYTPGVLSAAKQAGITTLGAALASSSDAKAVNLGYVSLDFTPSLRQIVANVGSDKFAGKSYLSTISNGGLVFADFNPVKSAPAIDTDFKNQITKLGEQIASGEVKIPETLP